MEQECQLGLAHGRRKQIEKRDQEGRKVRQQMRVLYMKLSVEEGIASDSPMFGCRWQTRPLFSIRRVALGRR